LVELGETFARRYFPDGDAVGRHIGRGNDPDTELDTEIVGVVADAMNGNMRQEIPRQVFLPYEQAGVGTSVVFYARTTTDATALIPSIRSSMRDIDSNVPLYGIRTLDEQVDRSLTTERMISSLSSAFGLLATLLAVIGLYGVMSFSVARRAREIAIRMAFGAPAGNVVRMVMREVGLLVGLGIAIAIPSYLGLSSLIGSQLYGISTGDIPSVAGAVVLLGFVALLAGFLPARRAATIDPMRVLRSE
jgi:ABC-type antimicrobial peptide transport system permease subunit